MADERAEQEVRDMQPSDPIMPASGVALRFGTFDDERPRERNSMLPPAPDEDGDGSR